MSELYSKTILMMKVIVIMMMMKKMPLTMFMLLKRHPGVYHAVSWCRPETFRMQLYWKLAG